MAATLFPKPDQGGSEGGECGKVFAKKPPGFGAGLCVWEPGTPLFRSSTWLRLLCGHERGRGHSVFLPFCLSDLRLVTLPDLLPLRPDVRGAGVHDPGA